MKRMIFVVMLIIIKFCFSSTASAQMTVDWEFEIPPYGFYEAAFRSLEVFPNGNLLAVGNRSARLLAVQLSPQGEFIDYIWTDTLNIGTHIELNANNNLILSTKIRNTEIENIHSFDRLVNHLWTRNIGLYMNDFILKGNQIVIYGRSASDYPGIVALDLNGSIIWSRQYDFGFNGYIKDMISTSNGYTFTLSGDGPVILVVHTNAVGNVQWAIDLIYQDTAIVSNLHYLSDGGYIVAGYFVSGDEISRFVRLDNLGNMIFSSTFGEGNLTEMGDGSILTLSHGPEDAHEIFWSDASGILLNTFNYEYPGSLQQLVSDMHVTGDSSFAICGKQGNQMDDYVAAFVTHFTLPPTEVEINIQSYRDPLFIRQQGVFYWYGEVRNNTASPMTRDVWVQARKPDGSLSGALALWSDLEIPANGQITATVRQGVPLDAPLGGYNYIVRVGDYPNPQFQHHFTLTVVDTPAEEQPADMSAEPRPSDFTLRIEPDTWNVTADVR